MNTRNSTLTVIATLTIVAGASSLVSAAPVYIYAGDFNLPILDKPGPGSWMTEALIEVPDHFTIYDLDVGINLTHTNVFDLQIFVKSPLGTRLCLNKYDFKKEFFKGQNYVNTIFDDEAEISIEKGKAPFTGRFKPRALNHRNKLAVFDGQDTYGTWRLQIYDMFDWDTGTLNSFELRITVPEPTTAILLALGAGLITLLNLLPR